LGKPNLGSKGEEKRIEDDLLASAIRIFSDNASENIYFVFDDF